MPNSPLNRFLADLLPKFKQAVFYLKKLNEQQVARNQAQQLIYDAEEVTEVDRWIEYGVDILCIAIWWSSMVYLFYHHTNTAVIRGRMIMGLPLVALGTWLLLIRVRPNPEVKPTGALRLLNTLVQVLVLLPAVGVVCWIVYGFSIS